MGVLADIVEQEYSVDGQIDAGFLFASVKNTGENPVTVNGISLEVGEAKAYPFVGKAYPQDITFQITNSTLLVMAIY